MRKIETVRDPEECVKWGIALVPESPSSLGKKENILVYSFPCFGKRLRAWTTNISVISNNLPEMKMARPHPRRTELETPGVILLSREE